MNQEREGVCCGKYHCWQYPREDVARTIVAALEEKHTYKSAFDLIAGYDPIPDALQKF